MTAHLFLIQDTIQRFFRVEDIEKFFGLSALEVAFDADQGQKMATRMRDMIAEGSRVHLGADINIAQMTDGSNQGPVTDLAANFRKYLKAMALNNYDKFKERTLCHKCNEIPEYPRVTDCLHLYCEECLETMADEAARRGETQTKCMECGVPFATTSSLEGVSELAMLNPITALEEHSEYNPSKSQEESMRWIDIENDIVASTKTAAVQVQIEQWLNNEPDKKIIVFTQWQLMSVLKYCSVAGLLTIDRIEILGRTFERQGWGYYKVCVRALLMPHYC